jgi:rhodanese-related sulfurtransferase
MKTKNVTRLFLTLVAVLILLGGCTTTQTAKIEETKKQDTSWMFHHIVDAAFVKANVTVPMLDTVMLIDARPYDVKYTKGHIPGAISIPFLQFDQKSTLLPKDKNSLLIYYCGGLKCKLSHKSAKKAEALGYKNVVVFAKGYPEWISQPGNYGAVSVGFVRKQIDGNKTLIVDSRPQQTKFVKGHIPTAINIPFTQFDALSGKLPRALDTPVIFYCGGLKCRLSHKSAAKALAMGYTRVKVFEKGYPQWKKTYGKSAEALPVQAGVVEGSIDLERFKAIIAQNPESVMLIDVRDADEFAQGSFKTAVNIPVEELEPKIKDLPENKPIVFVCSTGARSGEAYYMTKDVRESLKDVFYVEAEVDFKSDGSFEIKKPE